MPPQYGPNHAWQGSHSIGFPPAVRRRILERDTICRWPGCVRPSTEADHIIEVSEGGTNDETNGQGLCSPHHQAKTLAHATAARLAKPRRQRPLETHPGLT